MSRKSRLPALAAPPSGPAGAQPSFGPRPLIIGEDAAAYDDLLARVSARVAPADILEELWVRDVVDLFWDALRLRRLKAKAVVAAMPEALANLLAPIIVVEPTPGVVVDEYKLATRLAERWALRDPDAIGKVDVLLAAASLSMDDVMARSLSLRLDEVERIDRMAMHAEIRRNAALREIERHRAAFAAAARRAMDEIADAEFEELPPSNAASPQATQSGGLHPDGDRRSAA